jgi:uncharacterized protein YaeQ
MAIKATIYKATLQIDDLDRQLYVSHDITIARHPSETDERMMIRMLAFALNVPANNDRGLLEFGKDMWDADEPALVQRDLTGQLEHWIEIGQPDEKQIQRLSGRSRRVSIYSFASSTPVWWKGLADKLSRAKNVVIWEVPAAQSQALSALAQRTMHLHVTRQEDSVWFTEGEKSVEVVPVRLLGEPS